MNKTLIDDTQPAARSRLDRFLSFRRPPLVEFAAGLAATFAAGLAGSLVARLIGLPLPYMLGAFFVTVALGLYGEPIRHFRRARVAGQFVVGPSIGAQFTPAIVLKVVLLPPCILAGSLLLLPTACSNARPRSARLKHNWHYDRPHAG